MEFVSNNACGHLNEGAQKLLENVKKCIGTAKRADVKEPHEVQQYHPTTCEQFDFNPVVSTRLTSALHKLVADYVTKGFSLRLGLLVKQHDECICDFVAHNPNVTAILDKHSLIPYRGVTTAYHLGEKALLAQLPHPIGLQTEGCQKGRSYYPSLCSLAEHQGIGYLCAL